MSNEAKFGSIRDIDADEDASRASSASIWTVPPISTHPLPDTAPANQSEPNLSSDAESSQKRRSSFLATLDNILRRGLQPPPKPRRSPQTALEKPVHEPTSVAVPSAVTEERNDSADVLGDPDDKKEKDEEKGSKGSKRSSLLSNFGEEGAHPEDENQVRGNWGSHIEFLLSCIGYAVGLGNVWRFPYLCYKNGGGSFLVIYWILHATVGFPIIFLELSLGQFTSQGPTGVWSFAPIVKGLGYSMVCVSAIAAIYYNIIIAWAFYYLFVSFYGFAGDLPWKNCDFDDWANYRCKMNATQCSGTNQVRAYDGLCYNFGSQQVHTVSTVCNQTSTTGNKWWMVTCEYIVGLVEGGSVSPSRENVVGFWDETLAGKFERSSQFSSEQYFFHEALGQQGMDDPNYSATHLGPPQKWLALSLLLAWIIVYLCLLNGIKSSGKVVYFTALFPYVVLAILIGRAVSLPGALEGIKYLLTPDFTKMQEPNVWYAAASQLFFSLAACWGGMMALSSYNKFHTNTVRDTLIITAADTFTSFFASFAIFSVIGYGAYELKKPIEKVAQAGTGLAFILYPKIIDYMPGSVAFALLFFLMLLLLGLDSEFNTLETIFTALLDKYPSLRSSLKRKALAFCIFCIPFFLLGLPMICSGGINLLELVDTYGPGWPVFLIGIIETLTIAWVYGADNFHKDLAAMMPWLINRPRVARVAPIVMRIYWGVITPSMLLFVLIFSWIQYKSTEAPGEIALGWCITIFVMMWIPIFAVWVVAQESYRKKNFWAGFKAALGPSPKWGPYLEVHRREVAALHGDLLGAARSVDNSLECVVGDEEPQTINGGDKSDDGNDDNHPPANPSGSFGSSYMGAPHDSGVVNAGLSFDNLSVLSKRSDQRHFDRHPYSHRNRANYGNQPPTVVNRATAL